MVPTNAMAPAEEVPAAKGQHTASEEQDETQWLDDGGMVAASVEGVAQVGCLRCACAACKVRSKVRHGHDAEAAAAGAAPQGVGANNRAAGSDHTEVVLSMS